MGLNADLLDTLLLLNNKKLIPKNRSVAEIGAQQLGSSFIESYEQLENFAKVFCIKEPVPKFITPNNKIIAHGALEHLAESAPSSQIFWRWAKYEYMSIDVDTQFNSIALDVNFDGLPKKLRNKYSLVTNYGTTEHVANQLNAFKVIHDLTALNGVMVHALPSQGMLNHGLINYNPKFFWMLCRSNDYEVIDFRYGYDKTGYEFPDNISDFMDIFHVNSKSLFRTTRVVDAYIYVVLRKKHLSCFVPPLDVPTGATSAGPKFTRRYWSIFKKDPIFSVVTTDSKMILLKKIIMKILQK